MNNLLRAILDGHGYRISKRQTLADGEEFIIHIDPDSDSGTVALETPAISTPQACDIDVWENADPGSNTVDDLFVHNMRYDEGDGTETPLATVVRVSNGGLTTTSADQTEQTRIQANREYNTPGGAEERGIWRVIPPADTISFVITDQSNGSGNVYGFDAVLYEQAGFIND